MSLRKEAFQSKVLQRLYSSAQKRTVLQPAAAQKPKQTSLAPPAEKPQGIPQKEPGNKKCSAVQGKKLYTVLPPPEGYLITSGNESVTPSNPDSIGSEDSTGDAADHTLHAKRKRRRKKKAFPATTIKNAGEISASPAEGAVESQKDAKPSDKDQDIGSLVEKLSKNKRRKMKKKRHKEKLFALGLVPRSRALEFTYKQSCDEGTEEELEEVLEFLHNINEIYISDRSQAETGHPLSFSAVESLFSRLSGETLPPAEITRLCGLRALLVKGEEQLISKLQEFRDTSTLPADEVSVVCTLLEYWLSEILPMQRETT
ncbi:glutamate-rich protein 1 [Triplophysa rosa]|uniref:Glutamate-rich protein 1 n=1 Tax=Triplophysa rosa TaxID=992332 RepID=A0A9W7TWH1_TRIRA|nr:glutamate-rich protein 1 [Triplophysa rosa]KAI7804389.1 putative glutamate-rich protein 1 [Triplophysa rosa]